MDWSGYIIAFVYAAPMDKKILMWGDLLISHNDHYEICVLFNINDLVVALG